MSTSAGPSRTPLRGPPPLLAQDDQEAAAEARHHLSPKIGLFRVLPSFHRARPKWKDAKDAKKQEHGVDIQQDFLPTMGSAAFDTGLVQLHDDLLGKSDTGASVYRWAVLYENQRGATFFSSGYYSPQTLLPFDPPAYTLPTPKPSKRVWRKQPTVSLSSYPLPDGTWHWISHTWMVDMRGDGEVQHDGFEYAWSFRSRNWRAEVGFLSAGGFVRRRRWVRLMARDEGKKIGEREGAGILAADAERAGKEVEGEREEAGMQEASREVAFGPQILHNNAGATRPPSVVPSIMDEDEEGRIRVWRGDDGDWQRCHAALRRPRRDGKKLELWKKWFGFAFEGEAPGSQPLPIADEYGDTESDAYRGKGKVKARQYEVSPSSSQDNSLDSETGEDGAEIPKEYIRQTIRLHGSDILHLFVYPDSRAQFLEILDAAGMLGDLKSSMGISDSTEVLDFWSYAHHLEPLDGVGEELPEEPDTKSTESGGDES